MSNKEKMPGTNYSQMRAMYSLATVTLWLSITLPLFLTATKMEGWRTQCEPKKPCGLCKNWTVWINGIERPPDSFGRICVYLSDNIKRDYFFSFSVVSLKCFSYISCKADSAIRIEKRICKTLRWLLNVVNVLHSTLHAVLGSCWANTKVHVAEGDWI